MKVTFQGAPGAYSEVAAGHLFGSGCRMVPCEHFEDVFLSVKEGRAHRGVIPIENTLAGSIHQNYDLLHKYGLNIIKETNLRIEHVLMAGRHSSLAILKEVISHPQALSQCSAFFSRHKKIKSTAFYDTAGAARSIAENGRNDMGAIASVHAARLYGLKILKRNLENNHQNFTRFLGISRRAVKPAAGCRVKTSLSFAPQKNETGVLYKMLGIFALRNINLLKIESRPIQGRAFEYVFYLDFEGALSDKQCRRAVDHLREMSSMFQLFGSYEAGGQTYIE